MNQPEPEQSRDYPLLQIPGYREWSTRKLREGESEALIANLDATCMWLDVKQLKSVGEAEFEELLSELKNALDDFR